MATPPLHGGVRLCSTTPDGTQCSKEINQVELIPSGIVKRLVKQHAGGESKENMSKVSNLRRTPSKQVLSSPKSAHSKSPSNDDLQKIRSNSTSSISHIGTITAPSVLQSSSTISSLGDKYGRTLASYDSFSSNTINPRSEEILAESRNYVGIRDKLKLNTADSISDSEYDITSIGGLDSIIMGLEKKNGLKKLGSHRSVVTNASKYGMKTDESVACTVASGRGIGTVASKRENYISISSSRRAMASLNSPKQKFDHPTTFGATMNKPPPSPHSFRSTKEPRSGPTRNTDVRPTAQSDNIDTTTENSISSNMFNDTNKSSIQFGSIKSSTSYRKSAVGNTSKSRYEKESQSDVSPVHLNNNPTSSRQNVVIERFKCHTDTDLAEKTSFESSNILPTKPLISSRLNVVIKESGSHISAALAERTSFESYKSTSMIVSPLSQTKKAIASPRNQQILNGFKSRVNALSSPQSRDITGAHTSQGNLKQIKKPNTFIYTSDRLNKTESEKFEEDNAPSSTTRTKNTLSPIISFEGILDAADQSILDTTLCKKFIEAFEFTLKDNPGILPGSHTVIRSLEHSLAKLTQERDDTEYQMRGQIQKVKNKKCEIEDRLIGRQEALGDNIEDLAEQLESDQQDKACVEKALKELLDEVKATKDNLEQKTENATKEKDELSTHLTHLSTTRSEIKASLDEQLKILEEERESLLIVDDTRNFVNVQKEENKQLENEIEIRTETISTEKIALQAQSAEIKSFEAELQKLRASNEAAQRELDDEKKEFRDMTLRLQQQKLLVIERKAQVEKDVKLEKKKIENQIDRSRTARTTRFTKSKVRDRDITTLIQSCLYEEVEKKAAKTKPNKVQIASETMKPELEKKSRVKEKNINGLKERNEKTSRLVEDPLTGGVEIEAFALSRVEQKLKQYEMELDAREDNSERSLHHGTSSMSTEETRNTSYQKKQIIETKLSSGEQRHDLAWSKTLSYDKYDSRNFE